MNESTLAVEEQHRARQMLSTSVSSISLSGTPSSRSAGKSPSNSIAEATGRPVHPFRHQPIRKPTDPRFSSGPCRKHPGWNISTLNTKLLGRSHRASEPKNRLKSAIDRSASLIHLPTDWKLGIVPGSDTGAFEIAIWTLLGNRPVDALVWDAFSSDWAHDLKTLAIDNVSIFKADFGQLPDLSQINSNSDVVFAYNGTTSGTWVPDLDWLGNARKGLVLCDATSVAFARELDFTKLDAVTWSWQKVLGGEAAHGMLALSPKAIARLESDAPIRALPKLFSLCKQGKLTEGIFSGATINTPSMLAVEDLHSALDWAESIGGLTGLQQRTQANFQAVDTWVQKQNWIDWLATSAHTRSQTSLCLRITDPNFTALSVEQQQAWVTRMVKWLEEEDVAYDIGNYRSAPPGFRLWGGPTIDVEEFEPLTQWLEWAFKKATQMIDQQENPYV